MSLNAPNDTLPAAGEVRRTINLKLKKESPPKPSATPNTCPPPADLLWDVEVKCIGEKAANTDIHLCLQCTLPILVYGRHAPCKHVFCYDCACDQLRPKVKGQPGKCLTCQEEVKRVEKCMLGDVFMCNFGATDRYGLSGCSRTYLSKRDLEAHFEHRHAQNRDKVAPMPSTLGPPSSIQTPIPSLSALPRQPAGMLCTPVSHSVPMVPTVPTTVAFGGQVVVPAPMVLRAPLGAQHLSSTHLQHQWIGRFK